MLYIASDHGGFEVKEKLLPWLVQSFGEVTDLGPRKLNPKDDYPKFAALVARQVASGKWLVASRKQPISSSTILKKKDDQIDLGILICRSGQGMCMAANRFKGVRAALAWNVKLAKASRQDDLANILCLPSDYLSFTDIKKIITAWVSEPAGKDRRFVRRAMEMDSLL